MKYQKLAASSILIFSASAALAQTTLNQGSQEYGKAAAEGFYDADLKTTDPKLQELQKIADEALRKRAEIEARIQEVEAWNTSQDKKNLETAPVYNAKMQQTINNLKAVDGKVIHNDYWFDDVLYLSKAQRAELESNQKMVDQNNKLYAAAQARLAALKTAQNQYGDEIAKTDDLDKRLGFLKREFAAKSEAYNATLDSLDKAKETHPIYKAVKDARAHDMEMLQASMLEMGVQQKLSDSMVRAQGLGLTMMERQAQLRGLEKLYDNRMMGNYFQTKLQKAFDSIQFCQAKAACDVKKDVKPRTGATNLNDLFYGKEEDKAFVVDPPKAAPAAGEHK